MAEKRRDSRNRILHNGEIQLASGQYRFKFVDYLGREKAVYSWRLDKNDINPPGKKKGLSLRELEKQIQADQFDCIVPNGGDMTVLTLVERYIETKTGVRPNTRAG